MFISTAFPKVAENFRYDLPLKFAMNGNIRDAAILVTE
jgi:hypothetical protein